MAKITQQTIDKIYDAVRIEEVVGDYVNLKKRGTNYQGLCPFHNEKTPSFSVSPAKGIYKCFGCSAGGSSISFIMDIEHLSYPEALKQLAKKYHIEVEEEEVSQEQKERYNKRESLLLLTEFAQEYFVNQLKESQDGRLIAQPYLEDRKISSASVETFKIGFLPNKSDAFAQFALKKGYKREHLQESGLSVFRDNGSVYDRFKDRLIFPIHSLSGRVIGFGARILRNDKKVAKYVNSPESDIYHKSQVLYGIYQAKKSIVKKDNCILVEGYTDVISLHQAGIENAVASSGTALTPDQVRLIKRFTENLTVIFDGDAAGIKASLRGIDIILEYGLNVNVLLLPDGEDPDSFSKQKTTEELQNYIKEHSVSFIDFKIKLFKNGENQTIVEKTNWLRSIIRSIAKVPDPLKRTVFIQNAAPKLELDEKVLFNELQTQLKQKVKDDIKEAERKEKLESRQQQQAHLEIYPEYAQEVTTPVVDTTKTFAEFSDLATELEYNLLKIYLKFSKEILHIEIESEEEKKEFIEISVAEFIEHSVEEEEFSFQFPIHREIYNFCVEQSDKEEEIDFISALLRGENQEIVKYVSELLHERHQLANWEKHDIFVKEETTILEKKINQYIWRYQLELAKGNIKNIQERIKACTETEKRNEIMNEYKNLLIFIQILQKKLGKEV
ncbi:MAG: DNA primase [Flavobacteriales bacterium]|jgi:DNA primase|nr:DNA primase [Flavobacteriales bacterium]